MLEFGMFFMLVAAQQDCSNLVCPENHVRKVSGATTCRAVCDVAVDLYRCCDQLCSSFACAPASKNLPEVACRGPCHPTRDLARCCEVPAVQPESVQLLRASAAGEVLGVKRLTVMNANTSGAAPAATTALHFASLHGHVEVVRNLIDRRANVNALDDHGWAPLHLAAAAGRVGVMNLLIEAGAVPDQRSPDGTPHDVALRTLSNGILIGVQNYWQTTSTEDQYVAKDSRSRQCTSQTPCKDSGGCPNRKCKSWQL
ncbi:unnamed protein product [Durusdinium trenchii]|uniref:Uncharacterized protein n=1 Tax=Durusdinium trenchii TaxID=1381693 RepID=A0ABP0KUY5_9DINO